MSTIYKYNNYILKPLTMLHLEVNTVGLVKMVFSEEKKMLKVVDTSNRNVPSAGFSSFSLNCN